MMQLRTLARSALFAAAALFLMPVLPAQAAVTLTEGVNYKTLEPAVPTRRTTLSAALSSPSGL